MPDSRSADSPVVVAPGVYWIGTADIHANLLCNPFLIVDGGQAVVIDGGSRSDFPTVMTKILQVGVAPDQIVALVYQHHDPDLCGSMPNFLGMCRNSALRIVSASNGLPFISHYLHSSQFGFLKSIEELEYRMQVGGRDLVFYPTPYAHSSGSFVTHDTGSGVLFTSDLFGCYGANWDLVSELPSECHTCRADEACPNGRTCPVPHVIRFHRQVMPCVKALRHALRIIQGIPAVAIAPQHGTVFATARDRELIIARLRQLDDVGIDGIVVDT